MVSVGGQYNLLLDDPAGKHLGTRFGISPALFSPDDQSGARASDSNLLGNVVVFVHWTHAVAPTLAKLGTKEPTPHRKWIKQHTTPGILLVALKVLSKMVFQRGQPVLGRDVNWAGLEFDPRAPDWVSANTNGEGFLPQIPKNQRCCCMILLNDAVLWNK